ncbi:MAG TPA: carboxypeptidase-like regulatory domain-containing protein [Gemmatimonadaceae bacterium]|jgi:hypothetical protein
MTFIRALFERLSWVRSCSAASLFLLAVPTLARGQQRPQAIVGRVTTDSGAPIRDADIFVTIAPSAETVSGKSDSTGAYRVTIVNATGEYLLYIGAVGRKPFRQRVTMAAGDSIAVVNAKLASAVTTVAAVQVQARRPRPTRGLGGDNNGAGTDGNSKVFDGVTNSLPPELQGNFDAMAALIPGLAVSSNGVSAFGMGSDANMTTLNGMTFTGGAVPKDLKTTTNFLLSPWDPTLGGFSGALTQATVARGTNITQHAAHLTVDDPALQATDPTAARFGQKFTNIQASDTRSGAFSLDKYFYNYSIQASRQTAPVSSLLDLDADALAHAGISADSALRLTQILGGDHIPLTAGGIPSERTTTSALFLERFDRAVPNPAGNNAPAPIYSLIVGGNYLESAAPSLAPTTLPAYTGKTTTGGAFAQALYSTYFGAFGDYINETATGLSYRDTRGSPYLTLPSGNVLIASSLGADVPTIGSLNFGGNSGLARDNRVLSWEATNQTNFLVDHQSSLPGKLYFQSRYEHFDQSLAANRLGAFNFASLSDLANNAPSSFSRTLNVPDRSGGEWTGAGALGGSWTIPKLTLAGGARVDANSFTGVPTLNRRLATTFGIPNNAAPNSVALSPRLGFNWFPHAQRGMSIFGGSMGSTYRGGYQIRGGVGEFRNFLPSTLLADAIGSTGLPGSTERLSCVGPASPTPNWAAYMTDPSSVPSTCADGGAAFADTVPSAVLVDPSYSPSRAWRATLGWTNTLFGNYIAVDGTYSWNLDQAGNVDLNFAGARQFALNNEGGRPVFVPATSIVAATGSVSPVYSRMSPNFGQVIDRVSDLRGATRQITVYAIPNVPFRWGLVTLGYSYIDARSQARGFDQSTSTDPRLVEWAPSAFTPRHNFTLQAAHLFFQGKVGLTWAGRVMSGQRYTPTVAGDVNGDGWLNDRAFIFNPARADTAVARGIKDLLATGSGSAKTCIASQLGTLASRNSCVGPWTATMNASVFVPYVPGTNRRMQASLNIANPLGGLDQLLHGSSKLHGWGSAPLIDGTLYQVRGFDPSTQQFVYAVNPRFGATSPSASTFRTPFRLTLDVRLDYGRSSQEQALDLNLRIKPPLAGTRATADTIKNRYMKTGFSDVYMVMLHYADSLALNQAQMEKMLAQQKILQAKADSIYGSLAGYLVALPSDYDVKTALARTTKTSDDMWNVVYAESPFIKGLLTPGQIRLLPAPIRDMVTTPGYKGRFFFGF